MDPFLFVTTALSVGSKLFGGFASKRQSTIRANIERDNAALAKIQATAAREGADYAYERGGFEKAKVLRNADKIASQQTAYFAANNIDTTYGSPLLMVARTAAQGQTDAELIEANATMEASRELGRAASYTANAATSSWNAVAATEYGDNAMIAGVLGAGTSILTGYKQFKGMGSGSGDLGATDIGQGAQPWMLNFRGGL